MNNFNSVLLRQFTTLVFLFCIGNIFAQTQDISPKKEAHSQAGQNTKLKESQRLATPPNFKVLNEGAPQGNSVEDQIARAKYYQAQYKHDAATQAKYQIEIDVLEKKRLEEGTKKD